MTAIIPFIARSSLVLAAGLLALAILRRQPAALRHWILTAAFALAVLQPAITFILPALPLPLASLTVNGGHRAAAATVETSEVFEVVSMPKPAPASVDWQRLLVGAWLIGVVASLAALSLGMVWLLWLGARSVDAGPQWTEAEALARSQVRIRRRVRIAITKHPAIIVTWGVIAPVILLPADADDWNADRKRLVIAHEMAHLARQDWLIQLLAETARSINWFNPLFWIACARLRSESEYACDDVVLESGIAGTSYASHLVDLARALRVHGRTWLPAPSMARPSTLERRVRAMLNPHVNRRQAPAVTRLAVIAVLCAIALPIAAASQASSTPVGTVSDPMGRPLADATLRLTSVNGGEPIETRTDANGNFQFPQMAPGDYMLAVRYPGFSSSRQRMQLNAGGTTIALQVQVGTLRETITVAANSTDSTRKVTDASKMPAPKVCVPSSAGGQLIPPMKVRDVRPRYKQEWIDGRVEGDVLMRATIGKDGKVRSVDVISPVNVDLEDEAMAAVSQWQFTPTYLNCEPMEVQMYVTVSFKIDR